MTTVRLNKDIEDKLSILTELEKTSKSELIKKALIEYYNSHVKKETPYELGKDLFGKFGSDEDLSTTYKTKIKEKIKKKNLS